MTSVSAVIKGVHHSIRPALWAEMISHCFSVASAAREERGPKDRGSCIQESAFSSSALKSCSGCLGIRWSGRDDDERARGRPTSRNNSFWKRSPRSRAYSRLSQAGIDSNWLLAEASRTSATRSCSSVSGLLQSMTSRSARVWPPILVGSAHSYPQESRPCPRPKSSSVRARASTALSLTTMPRGAFGATTFNTLYVKRGFGVFAWTIHSSIELQAQLQSVFMREQDCA